MDTTVDLGRRLVQMFWDPEPTNDMVRDQPAWCLGRSYRLNSAGGGNGGATTTNNNSHSNSSSSNLPPADDPQDSSSPASNDEAKDTLRAASTTKLPDTPPDSISSSFDESLAYEEAPRDGGWPPAFLDDIESRVWMTYRSEFDPIPKSHDPKALAALSFSMRLKTHLSDAAGFASDSGWGCMIRSGQMMLANAIVMHRLGRDWRRGKEEKTQREILSLFSDDPRAPYSIHNFVRHGANSCGKYPGEWFGPSATARCIQALANANEPALRVYSTGDGPDVYEDSFFKIAKPDGNRFHPTLVLVGTRLGIEKITPVYWEALVASLQMPQSIGIAGGRPSSSHYFIGVQGLNFFYLDPHLTRPGLSYHETPEDYTREEVDTCHTRKLRQLHVREMDPSMLIGFLIRDEEDWVEWRKSVKHVQGKTVIHVSDQDPVAQFSQQSSAIDQVETLSDDDEDADVAFGD